jgi:hypothetical protein
MHVFLVYIIQHGYLLTVELSPFNTPMSVHPLPVHSDPIYPPPALWHSVSTKPMAVLDLIK